MKKNWPLEHRFPTKKARDKADAAIDALPHDTPMSECIDMWLRTYRETGGVENRPKD